MSVGFITLQVLKHFSSKDQIAMKEAKLKLRLKKQQDKQNKAEQKNNSSTK